MGTNHHELEEFDDRERRKPDSRVGKMYTDLYTGRGKSNPSITTRLALLEDDVGEVKSTLKKVERLAWAILLSLIATLVTIALKGKG